jgi:glycosyltransferase involved in cell wall biosynthesis
MITSKVSIITTVYNREKYLAACIESVLASSFQDWELIIVDDGSKDNSVDIAQQYAAKDPRIQVYINDTNLGDYPNRNRAASYAKGIYLKYLDADDLIYPHGLKIMVETMEQFPDCALGISQEVAEDIEPFPFVLTPYKAYYREFLKRGVLGMPPTNTIIKRDVFEFLGQFSTQRYTGDTEFWLRLSRQFNVVKMVPGLVYWRRHEDQEYQKGLSSLSYLEHNYKNTMAALTHDLCPLKETDLSYAKKRINYRLARGLLTLIIKNREFYEANRIRKSCGKSWCHILKEASVSFEP